MKNLIALIFIIGLGTNLAQGQENTPPAVTVALDHLNQYLLDPIALDDPDVQWGWAIIGLDDFGENCRERGDRSAPLPTIAYDVHFFRMAESYHYRLSPDLQLIVPCLDPVDFPEEALPPVVDALDDLNRRVHASLGVNDLPWRWEETQFRDYTLDCPQLEPPKEEFDQKINGYIVTFAVMGEEWQYRVSSDRLIVMLCREYAGN